MEPTPTPFDLDAPAGAGRLIVRRSPDSPHKPQAIAARWGSDPRFSDGVAYRFVRSEGKSFPSHRCLIPATQFEMRVGKKRYRAQLDGGNHFYLAGVWEPALAGWPLSFKIITVDANLEVAPYQDRHGAIIHRRQVMQWLDGLVPIGELLVTPPARTFVVEEIGDAPTQAALIF
ncbi:SOS response-associated peptidase family protein [Sphingomonas kyeonggiensis]|uniref:Putative SOS response-associated peptidase YedK n=1 Tax=Sphingomonas kyeonggiensis TaxID=1268553 RepID=A0A7W6NUV6_9SPHN|nr:SOS response-associated peptidase family protein [Sphingomonas kyeonggiensis]MBB4097459.1 putative SOS response-associated peptidase YedK [Sphingomonas kyeonggiensis]